jgi:dihydroorotase
MSQLLIKQARVIDPASDLNKVCDVLVSDGKITQIETKIKQTEAMSVIDASGKWMLPGLIDLGAYVRNQERVATIESESIAAANAGITRLCCMPESAKITDTTAEVTLIQEKASHSGKVWFEVIGSMTAGLGGEQLSNMAGLKKAGCVAVSQGHHEFQSLDIMRKAMEYAQTCGIKLFLQPLEHGLAGKGCVHDGAIATRVGLPGVPVAAETVALSQILLMAEQTHVDVHFCRLSSAAGVEMVRQAKARGLPVTADVAAHQLHLSERDIAEYNPLCHTLPPLRSESDRDALRQAVREGVIDAICSDHQPHDIDAKLAPFQDSSPGISGLETLLPLTLKLVEEGALTLQEAIASITSNAADIIHRPHGRLNVGCDADFLIYDPQKLWQFDPAAMYSNGKNSPFKGWEFNGKLLRTYVKGQRVDHNTDDKDLA